MILTLAPKIPLSDCIYPVGQVLQVFKFFSTFSEVPFVFSNSFLCMSIPSSVDSGLRTKYLLSLRKLFRHKYTTKIRNEELLV